MNLLKCALSVYSGKTPFVLEAALQKATTHVSEMATSARLVLSSRAPTTTDDQQLPTQICISAVGNAAGIGILSTPCHWSQIFFDT
jgi:hypothetical protein